MYTAVNTLALNPSYMVLYQKTKHPYITEEGDAVIYMQKEDAERFLKENEGTILDDAAFHKPDELCSFCYSAGAKRIRIVMPRCEKERYENLVKMPIRKHYNHTLNQKLSLLQETKKKTYLYGLKDENFIVPVKITNHPVIKVEYSIAKINDRRYFLAFSRLEEYSLWVSQVEGYEALEITYDEMVALSNGDDILLNVYGARYILSQEKIKKIGQNIQKN